MLSKLREKYERKTLAEKLSLKKRMANLRYTGNVPLESFIMEFDDLIRKLSDADAPLEEMEKVCSFLLAMPKTYEYIVASIETMMCKEEVTLDFVKERLLDEERKKLVNRNVV